MVTLTPGLYCRSFESTSTDVFVLEPQKEHYKIETHHTIEAQGRVDCRREHSHMGYNLWVRECYSPWNTKLRTYGPMTYG